MFKLKKRKNSRFLLTDFVAWLFYGLLLAVILFEIIYFLRLTSFQPSRLSKKDFQVKFDPQIYLQEQIKTLSLEEKIAALFIIGFEGYQLDQETKEFIKKNHFKNFLLLERNIGEEEQLKGLISSLKKTASSSSLPVLVALDQEGGKVSRLRFPGFETTGQSEIKTIDQAYFVAQKRGQQLADLGIDLNFSPVVEVAGNENSYLVLDQRLFPGDKDQVFQLSQAMINGYQAGGVVPVVKHFPGGLGRTAVDPHLELPVLKPNKIDFFQDLYPFIKLISKDKVKALMISHLLYPQIDQQRPVSLSDKLISANLRKDLSFNGLVIIDDLNMSAVTNNFSLSQAAKQAFLAGADMVIISGQQKDQLQAYQTVFQAVKAGEISEKRVEESLERLFFCFNK